MITGFTTLLTKVEDDKVFATFVTILQSCAHLSSAYALLTQRDEVTDMDMIYALKYKCRNVHEDTTLVDKIEQNRLALCDLSSSDGSVCSMDSVSESSEAFRRASSSNPLGREMNKSYDEWHAWRPDNSFQVFLKNVIDKSIDC